MKRLSTLAILTFTFAILGVMTVYAGKKAPPPPPPVATVVATWSPTEQLTSISGDDRIVELEMSIQTDRQFWAMDMSCLVSQADVFEPALIDQTLTLSSAWIDGNDGINHYIDPIDTQYYDSGTNRIDVLVTRVGASNSPVGLNGTSYSQLLFNLELKIKQGLTGVINVGLTCDQMTFLDRNGNSIGEIAVSSDNLILRDGYTIQGKVARQGNSNTSDIEVTCEVIDGDSTVYTAGDLVEFEYDKKGRVVGEEIVGFVFDTTSNGGQPLRELGVYKCEFKSMIDNTEETVYLTGTSYVNLQTTSYTLQPVMLLSGDTQGDDDIDVTDFTVITGSTWDTVQTPYTSGDVNGDGTVNEIDLAIAAGNVGLSEAGKGVLMDHVIYSAARDYNGAFPNNTLAMGNVQAGNVSQLNSDRAFWPQMSPDGTQLAYYAKTQQAITIG